jgi:hypothetical protein
VRSKLKRHLVGIGFCAANVAPRAAAVDDNVLDRVPAHVIVAAQVRAGAEQAPKGAIVERRQCFGKR